MTRTSDWVLLGLGANLGDPHAQLLEARVELESRLRMAAAHASSIWCSRPLDCPPASPDFLNAVLAFPVGVASSAGELLSILQGVELAFGRDRDGRRNAPRTIDLDVLIFGDVVQSDPFCILPHPRALQRRFVVEPAAEVLPELIWPGTSSSVAELCAALRDDPGQAGIVRAPRQW